MIHKAKYLLFIHSINLYLSHCSRLKDRAANKTGKVPIHKELNVLLGSMKQVNKYMHWIVVRIRKQGDVIESDGGRGGQ